MNTKQTKQTEAIVRNEAWAKLTYEQQLADLDRRLGKGIGAKKQRARIQYKINMNNENWPSFLKEYYHVDTILRANGQLWLCNKIETINYEEYN